MSKQENIVYNHHNSPVFFQVENEASVTAVIIRKIVDTVQNDQMIYDYLSSKYLI